MTKPLVVVGDVLLDRDITGTAGRLCPDAPVPVVDVSGGVDTPGGAGLAALLISRRVGPQTPVVLVTGLADDENGRRLRDLLAGQVQVISLPLDGETPCKTRVRVGGQSLVRLDTGAGRAVGGAVPGAATAIGMAASILVSDYGRGITGLGWVRSELSRAAANGTPLIWDPHPKGAAPVPGTHLLTPNAGEAAAAGLVSGDDTGWPDYWAGADRIVVTRGDLGAELHRRAEKPEWFPVPPECRIEADAVDTCGAGDVFAAAAAVAMSVGATAADAVRDAVITASTALAPGGPKRLLGCSRRIASPAAVAGIAGITDSRGGAGRASRLVATGGCFDLLHVGHISLLRRARALGDTLVVCLNSDESIRRNKGPNRPLVPAEDRAAVLRALEFVDDVVIFGEDTPERVIASLRPDVWVKGDDYDPGFLPEGAAVRAGGGQVVVLSRLPGHSTSELTRAAAAS